MGCIIIIITNVSDGGHTVDGVRPSRLPRIREYKLATRTREWGDYLQPGGAELIAVSDGSHYNN